MNTLEKLKVSLDEARQAGPVYRVDDFVTINVDHPYAVDSTYVKGNVGVIYEITTDGYLAVKDTKGNDFLYDKSEVSLSTDNEVLNALRELLERR